MTCPALPSQSMIGLLGDGMRTYWCCVRDAHLREAYFVSPLSGSLHICNVQDADRMLAASLGAGNFSCMRTAGAFSLSVPGTASFPARPGRPPFYFRLLSALPLYPALRLTLLSATLVSCINWRKRSRSIGRMGLLSNWNATQTSTDCYPRALFNAYRLHLHGRDFCMWIGVFPPTNLMHSWVTVDGQPIGEHPDELMHFQPVVCYAVEKHGNDHV